MKRVIILFFAVYISFTFTSCTNLDEKLYSEIGSSNYYNNQKELNSAMLLPYKHLAAIQDIVFFSFEMQGDLFTLASKGPHGYDGGRYIRCYLHTQTPEDPFVIAPFNKFYEGVGHVNNVLNDLEKLDYSKIGLTEFDRQSNISEMKILRSYFYYMLLDVFGDVPLVTSLEQKDPKKSRREKIFNFIESEIKENVANLPLGGLSSRYGRMNQAAAYTILAKLYMNAEIYIGKAMYNECDTICQEIIDGKYGHFNLAKKWYEPFDYDNDKCEENIFSLPMEYVYTGKPFYVDWFYHYQSYVYFDSEPMGWNAIHLTPSRKPNGDLYDFNGLGTPYEAYDDRDLRKRPFNGSDVDSGGMFLVGVQKSPVTGLVAQGSEEYKGKDMEFVDYVCRASRGETVSNLTSGEENTGIRMVKYPLYPKSQKEKYYTADIVCFRLADIYYMKAECLLRTGGSEIVAADLINTVKKRNFKQADWSNVKYSTITLDEILRDRGREFLGECFRRQDLLRFGRYHEAYWDKPAGNKNDFLLPIPTPSISANPNLKEFED